MVICVMPGHWQFWIAMYIILGTFITKYCDKMSRLWDETVSQLEYKKKSFIAVFIFTLSQHHKTTGNIWVKSLIQQLWGLSALVMLMKKVTFGTSSCFCFFLDWKEPNQRSNKIFNSIIKCFGITQNLNTLVIETK